MHQPATRTPGVDAPAPGPSDDAPRPSGRDASRRRTGRVAALAVGLAAVTAVLAAPLDLSRAGPGLAPWPLFAVAFALVDATAVRLHIRRDTHSFTMTEAPLAVGLFLLDPLALIGARVLGGVVALVVRERQGGLKLAFNTVLYAFEVVTALAVFAALRPAGPLVVEPGSAVAALVAVLVSGLAGMLAVAGVISLAQGRVRPAEVRETLIVGATLTTGTAVLGLLIVAVIVATPALGVLTPAPAAMFWAAQRGYLRQRHARQVLAFAHELMRLVHRAPSVDAGLTQALRRILDLFRAERAQLVFRDDGGDVAMVVEVDDGRERLEHRPAVGVATAPPAEVDALVAPLRVADEVVGVCRLGPPVAPTDRYARFDRQLLRLVTDHLGAALENTRLAQQLDRLAELNDLLRHRALHDDLTGLANRALFRDRLEQALAVAGREGRELAVLMLDLDGFKAVNDTLGHDAGDRLLRACGRRLSVSVRPGDTVARLGGDEFAVLLVDLADRDEAEQAARRIVERLRPPVDLHGERVRVSASVGLSFARPGDTIEKLLQDADLAMYRAKMNGRGRIERYDPRLRSEVTARMRLNEDMAGAVERDEFELHFQPIVDLTDGRIVAAEALLRWNSPDRGVVGAHRFIRPAEEQGVLDAVGDRLRGRALAAFAAWRRERPDLRLYLNVTGEEVCRPGFVDSLLDSLAAVDVPPAAVSVELSEWSAPSDTALFADALRALRGVGVGLAVDDFGEGHAVVGDLARYPVTSIKVPRSIVFGDGDSDGALLDGIIDLARRLDLEVVGEGVEQARQVGRLVEAGVRLAQGHYFAEAVPVEEFGTLLRLDRLERAMAPDGRRSSPGHGARPAAH